MRGRASSLRGLRRSSSSPSDPFHWLEEGGARAEEYLQSESDFAHAWFRDSKRLKHRFRRELRALVPRTTSESSSERVGDWWYYARARPGDELQVYCRRRYNGSEAEEPAEEEIILDPNALLREGSSDALSVGGIAISNDHRMIAYALDISGGEDFAVHVRDLSASEGGAERTPPLIIPSVASFEWAPACPRADDDRDGYSLVHSRPDATGRPSSVLSTDIHVGAKSEEPSRLVASKPRLLLEETDRAFFADLRLTKDRELIAITLRSKVATEAWLYGGGESSAQPMLVMPRTEGVEYQVEHNRGHVYAVTNTAALRLGDAASELEVLRAPIERLRASAPAPKQRQWHDWEIVVEARDGVGIDDMDIFADHVVLYERYKAQQRVAILSLDDIASGLRVVPLDHLFAGASPYAIAPYANARFDSASVRFEVSSPINPPRTVECSLNDRTACAVSPSEEVPSWKPEAYTCERLWSSEGDSGGVRVPITVARRTNTALDGSAPLLLCAYGAYGVSMDALFDVVRLPLLERGWIVATAHPRGGGELGRAWHHAGRLEQKRNTLEDVASCIRTLHVCGYGAPERTAVMGRSAGALAVAGVACTHPELITACVLQAPFLDVVGAMHDADCALTDHEHDEWGSPNAQASIEQWSPYQMVLDRMAEGESMQTLQQHPLPAMLLTGELNDPRVPWHHAAKFVAALRCVQQTSASDAHADLLLELGSGASHFGSGGRYARFDDDAREYAFLTQQIKITTK